MNAAVLYDIFMRGSVKLEEKERRENVQLGWEGGGGNQQWPYTVEANCANYTPYQCILTSLTTYILSLLSQFQ